MIPSILWKDLIIQNLRSSYTLERKRDHTVYQGPEFLSSFAPKLYDLPQN